MWRACLPAVHPSIARSLGNIGSVLQSMGRHGEALSKLEEALEIRKACLPAGHPAIAISLKSLCTSLWKLSFCDEAVRCLEAAFDIQVRRLPPGHPHLVDTHQALVGLRAQLSSKSGSRPSTRDRLRRKKHREMLQRVVATAKSCREAAKAAALR